MGTTGERGKRGSFHRSFNRSLKRIQPDGDSDGEGKQAIGNAEEIIDADGPVEASNEPGTTSHTIPKGPFGTVESVQSRRSTANSPPSKLQRRNSSSYWLTDDQTFEVRTSPEGFNSGKRKTSALSDPFRGIVALNFQSDVRLLSRANIRVQG